MRQTNGGRVRCHGDRPLANTAVMARQTLICITMTLMMNQIIGNRSGCELPAPTQSIGNDRLGGAIYRQKPRQLTATNWSDEDINHDDDGGGFQNKTTTTTTSTTTMMMMMMVMTKIRQRWQIDYLKMALFISWVLTVDLLHLHRNWLDLPSIPPYLIRDCIRNWLELISGWCGFVSTSNFNPISWQIDRNWPNFRPNFPANCQILSEIHPNSTIMSSKSAEFQFNLAKISNPAPSTSAQRFNRNPKPTERSEKFDPILLPYDKQNPLNR